MDVAVALFNIYPDAEYRGSLTANTEEAYDKIVWVDARPKPTWAELEAAGDKLPLPPVQAMQQIFLKQTPENREVFYAEAAKIGVAAQLQDWEVVERIIDNADAPGLEAVKAELKAVIPRGGPA